MAGDTKFSVLVSLFGWMQKSKSSAVKRSKFRKFLDTFCKPCDYFSAIRLILPSLDRERGTYGLKESVLATCLVDALGMSRDSEDAVRLFNWRRGGPKTGANAGNFAMVAAEVLQRRQGMASAGLTINELNDFLDRLASAENRAEKTSVLSTLIIKTNAQEMKWIVMIILKDLKLGISEKSIFHEFHPDAEDLFNVTCDLKLVCERLRDRRLRHKRQDIEVGKPVRPQLAMRVGNAATAWKTLHGKEVVIECKFDGDRIQIHKHGTDVHFFSRNFLDHSEYEHGMSDIIVQNILVDRCILDGEMLVWDKVSNHFAEFGSNQEIAKAAREGLDSDRQLCYVAFDILYSGDTSVIHQSLKERHELLRKVVKPVKGRLEILVPDGGLNTLRRPGEPCWSLIAHSQDDVERFFKETIENRDEGIVLKDLGSKWEPGDRSGKWSKLKPEYIRASSDLDVLIIGGYYGSGRRGGEVAQFLVGLAERPASNSYPRRFISFCRVGTGLSDEELDAVVTKLKPHFRKYEYPKKGPPSFYQVTNHSKERPDVWVESPEKSLIVAITSDIRTISSEVFSAPYSLRFPRIDRVRWDKPWHECLDMQSFIELVQSSNGTTQRDTGYKDQPEGGLKQKKSSEKGRKEKNMSLVPSHFTQTDVSHVKGESCIFSKMMFYFVNVPPNLSLDALHKMVVENSGTFSMNLNSSVTHCIAAEGKGFKFKAATQSKDVIHYSWLVDCSSQKKLLPLQPKYFLFLSDGSRKKLQEEIDEFSDSYYWDLDLQDIKQLLSNVKGSEDSRLIEYYKGKYCPKEKWSRFHGCSFHFLPLASKTQVDCEILSTLIQRRLRNEVCWGGGKISEALADATHLVVLEVPGQALDLHAITKGLSATEMRLLRKQKIYVMSSKWLEDCLESDRKLPEDLYKIHLTVADSSANDEGHEDGVKDRFSDSESREKLNPSHEVEAPSSNVEVDAGDKGPTATRKKSDATRKRGRPLHEGTKRGAAQARQIRPRLGKKPLKLSEYVSDDEVGSASDTMDKSKEENCDKANEGTMSEMCAETSGGNARKRGSPSATARRVRVGTAQPRPTRPRREKKPLKISRDASDIENSSASDIDKDLKGSRDTRDRGRMAEKTGEMKGDVESSPLRGTSEDHQRAELEKECEEVVGDKIIPKLEIMTDPLQAMLLDMIPSLRLTKVEPTSQPSQEASTSRPSQEASPGRRIGEEDKPGSEAGPGPSEDMAVPKKKKVSYKDLAMELLKDW